MDKTVNLERLLFEITVKPGKDINIRTQALLVIGKLIHVDPSQKVIPYRVEDEGKNGPLEYHYSVPEDLDGMKKYLAQPQYNPRTRCVIFYTQFTTTTSITELKKDYSYLEWLRENKVFIWSMAIASTENVRVGFFLGKASRMVNIKQMQEFICTRLSPVSQFEIPPFQLIHNT